MSKIKSKDTKPELLVRKYLYSCGFRYRLHKKDLPGKPDIVLKKYGIVIFVLVMALGRGVEAAAGEEELEEAIQEQRMGTLSIRARPGAKIRVTQLRHEFWFGTAISQNVFNGNVGRQDKEMYLQILKSNFNSAVHENAMKWYSTERKQGEITYQNADVMLKWCEDNDIRMRGHAVYWAVDGFVQDWVKRLDNENLRCALEARAKGLLTHYSGRIPEYDVNNEMIHGRYYAKRLGEGIREEMFQWCKNADPQALLYVNDYGILTGNNLSGYERHIEALLEAGVPVGGIGLQGHFSSSRMDTEKVKTTLDRLARFNLPIRITEFDMKTLDEEAKAKGLSDFYTTCFAHQAVEGILMWGFWAGSHWLSTERWGIPGYTALWDKDWNPTPAAGAYRDLVFSQWWTDCERVADAQGLCRVRAFYGKHKVSADSLELIVELKKGEGEKTVDFFTQQGNAGDGDIHHSRGDVNRDSKINIFDLLELLSILSATVSG